MGVCRTIDAVPMDEEMRSLQEQPLAFSSGKRDRDFITATCRMPFITSDSSALLNVECFFFDKDGNEQRHEEERKERRRRRRSPVLLYIHGVCSSAETKGVHRLAREARRRKTNVAVLELEGHGLSSGRRGVCRDFGRLVSHVCDFVRHVLTELGHGHGHGDGDEEAVRIPYVLGGNSLGGVLAAYASERILSSNNLYDDDDFPGRLVGVALVAPAVGVDRRAVPPAPVVAALRLLARVAPAARVPFLTPVENSDSYAFENSTRNFSGRWPLATCRVLLDVVSTKTTRDLDSGELTLERVPSLVTFVGEKDEVVPMRAVERFHDRIKTKRKELVVVPESGHDLMYIPASANDILRRIFTWIESLPT